MKTSLLFAALLPLLGGLNLSAQSSEILSFEYIRPYQETEIFQTGLLGLFDSNLGTLTGATLFLSGGLLTDLSVSSFAANTTLIQVEVTADLLFGSNLNSLNTLLAPETLGLAFDTGVLSYAVGQNRTFSDQEILNELELDLSSILGDLQVSGGGNFSLTAQTLSGIGIMGGGGNVSTSQTTEAFSGGRIVYSYNPVPEPGSALLVALALTTPWLKRRRSRSVVL